MRPHHHASFARGFAVLVRFPSLKRNLAKMYLIRDVKELTRPAISAAPLFDDDYNSLASSPPTTVKNLRC